MNRRKLAGAVSVALIAAGLSLGIVSPASATTSTYCSTHEYHIINDVPPTPNQSLYCQMQAGPATAGAYKYTGPIDGVMGTNSWKGVMSYLAADWGYTGPVDGSPGPNTYNAMIRAGNSNGQFGVQPQNGTLSQADWQNWAVLIGYGFFGD